MQIFMIILGILLILCGGSCMAAPLVTFLEASAVIMILLIVYGIAGIVRSIYTKDYGLNLIFSILSLIAGIVTACLPVLRLYSDVMLLIVIAVWFILKGIVSIAVSLKLKKTTGKNWVFGLIIGILGIALGLYSFFRPLVLSVTIGLVIGFYFIINGIDMIMISGQATE